MFRSLQRPSVLVAALLVSAATVVAVHEDRVASLLIVAAGVAVSAVVFGFMVDRRLGDSYEAGKESERRAIARDVAQLVEPID